MTDFRDTVSMVMIIPHSSDPFSACRARVRLLQMFTCNIVNQDDLVYLHNCVTCKVNMKYQC